MSKLQPVIKWSGSKRSQAKSIVDNIHKNYDTYYEPFCGGCSVLFYILNNCPQKFKYYVCNDINKPLINLYNYIKNDYISVYNKYNELWSELNKDNELERKKQYFNDIRAEFNTTHNPLLLFFLMRTCANGMPRYNLNGQFNTSFHLTRNGMTPDKVLKILEDWSKILNKYDVQFESKTYTEIKPSNNDFMYLDPPYFNTKGMYYGTIDYDALWKYLSQCSCDYMLSFDGIAGSENNIQSIPKNIYDKHILLDSGNSSFRRVIGTSNNTNVYESLYIKERING